LDLRVQRLEAAHPAIAVFELESERRVDAHADGDSIVQRHGEIASRHGVPIASIAALVPERLPECRLRAAVVELR
jgi:hypothetical protein